MERDLRFGRRGHVLEEDKIREHSRIYRKGLWRRVAKGNVFSFYLLPCRENFNKVRRLPCLPELGNLEGSAEEEESKREPFRCPSSLSILSLSAEP
jgi:hypothetical protein